MVTFSLPDYEKGTVDDPITGFLMLHLSIDKLLVSIVAMVTVTLVTIHLVHSSCTIAETIANLARLQTATSPGEGAGELTRLASIC